MSEQRNLILAIALSIAILLGFQLFYELPRMREQQATQPPTPVSSVPTPSMPGTTAAPGTAAPAAGPVDRTAALSRSQRVAIDNPRLKGSIALLGGRLDDVVLKTYRQTVNPDSPNIVVLSPVGGADDPYYAEFGWVADKPGVKLPDAATLWAADRYLLSPTSPVTLTWDNGEGLKFERRIEIDDRYLLTVVDRVSSVDGEANLLPYGLVSRTNTPYTLGFYILHEGLLGVLDGKLKEITYGDVKESQKVELSTTGGWIGITDKYWLTALIPDQKEPVKTRFTHAMRDRLDKYQVDFLGIARPLTRGVSIESTSRLFVGAKEVQLLDRYEQNLGIARFDLAVDFGWFYFLTKPIFHILDWLNAQVGNFGVAILVLTVAIKLLFFPLANKSYKAMSKLKALQPEMLKIRERYEEDRARMNQEMMALYKREKVNPAAGCLPVIIQIPVFFALYKVLFVTIEMRHAPFYGWIKDLSAQDPTSLFNLFGLIPWTPPDFLIIGVWPIIMGITMYVQQKLNPQPADPVQAKVFMFLPVLFTVLLANFPAGLVIYWAWNNVLSMGQQWLIMRQMGVKV
jgi:YidC/Oxa1 family membrane protein insertase